MESARPAGSQRLSGEPAWRLSPLLTAITVTPLRYQLLLGMWDNIFFKLFLTLYSHSPSMWLTILELIWVMTNRIRY